MKSEGIGEHAIRVLVVDDDAPLVRLVSLLLRTDGFIVRIALGGAAGLDALDQELPDVVLLDLAMPEVDGRAFYRRARESGYDGPIMICSAFGARDAQRELCAQAYIAKPFEPDALIASLRSLLPAGAN